MMVKTYKAFIRVSDYPSAICAYDWCKDNCRSGEWDYLGDWMFGFFKIDDAILFGIKFV